MDMHLALPTTLISLIIGLLYFLRPRNIRISFKDQRFYIHYQSGLHRLQRVWPQVKAWLTKHLFEAHLVGMCVLSVIALAVAIGLKGFVLSADPAARPYDETLLQKLPLTIAALCVLFPVAMVIIRVTVPGMYKYLNYTQPETGPDKDLIKITPTQRLCICLGFYLSIVLLGVLLFTGNL